MGASITIYPANILETGTVSVTGDLNFHLEAPY